MRCPNWISPLIAVLLIIVSVLIAINSVYAAPAQKATQSSGTRSDRPDPPPTQYPPSQADNGAQVYWGMCQDCHGDRGQGLTAEWRSGFAPEYQNCWASGCHGEDAPENSFLLPESGAPCLAGPGALPQFSTAFDLGSYIQDSMPLSPTGSLSSEQSWELTSFLLALNDHELGQITLTGNTSGAIPVHHHVEIPENEYPGTLLLGLVLLLAAVGVGAGMTTGAAKKKPGKENFYHHLHPPKIPAQQARFSYTLGAGGIAVFLSLVLLITGALEMYYYIPTPEKAGASIQVISVLVPYGNLVRNLHYWSAQLLVIAVMVHLIRIIYTGAYAPPRRFNYILGIILLVLVLLLDFTGYVLRWDEGIRWALVVGTNLLKTIPGLGEGLYSFLIGGSEPGLAALTRFYTWHIYGLSLAFIGVTSWHIFKVRRDGGISSPLPPRGEILEKIPRRELVRKEVLAMLIVGAILLLLSVLIPAPIDQPITDSGNLIGDSKAPWFFLWIQETLKWGDPFLWGVTVPILAVLLLALLPYILPNASELEQGRWFPSGNRVGQILGSLIIAIILILTIIGWIK